MKKIFFKLMLLLVSFSSGGILQDYNQNIDQNIEVSKTGKDDSIEKELYLEIYFNKPIKKTFGEFNKLIRKSVLFGSGHFYLFITNILNLILLFKLCVDII